MHNQRTRLLSRLSSPHLCTFAPCSLGGGADGGADGGVNTILAHIFFAPIRPLDDPSLSQRQSPFTPTLKHETDTSNFDMNALQKAQAERMRSQLEMDDGEDEEQPKVASKAVLGANLASATGDAPSGNPGGALGSKGGLGTGLGGPLMEEEGGSSGSAEDDEEDKSFKVNRAAAKLSALPLSPHALLPVA